VAVSPGLSYLARERTDPRWWAVRRAQNRKPANYLCPLCGGRLHALSEHMLITPEGGTARRRHAHAECVLAARRTGGLRTWDEFRRAQPGAPGLFSRLWRRARLAPRRPG
jgi:hypothetical protein